MDSGTDLLADEQASAPDASTAESADAVHSSSSDPVQTRSGRVIRPPEKYKDFVMSRW